MTDEEISEFISSDALHPGEDTCYCMFGCNAFPYIRLTFTLAGDPTAEKRSLPVCYWCWKNNSTQLKRVGADERFLSPHWIPY